MLDTGIDIANVGFANLNIVSYVSLAEGSQHCFGDTLTATDKEGHGTHVSGIVASRGGGSCPQCVGVAPGIDTLYALKVGYLESTGGGCSGGGSAYDDDVINAIDWALQQNPVVRTFNFSFGGPASGDDDMFSQILDQIGDDFGVNIAIAAGNTGNNTSNVETPGISCNGVTVASMDDQGNPADRSQDVISFFSLPGPTTGGRFKPDISAPGNHGNSHGEILSTCVSAYWGPGDYCQMAGTSMAAPHVAGSLALIRSAGAPDGLSAKAVLLNSALPYKGQSTWRTDSGWGFVNLKQASLEVANVVEGSVSAGQPAFYQGAATGTLKTTLVWNRHVTGTYVPYHPEEDTPLSATFSNLDLYAYDGASGNMIGNSTSTIQNVEQVIAGDSGNVGTDGRTGQHRRGRV